MFSKAVQPPILSLFSSTSTPSLSLFSVHTDASLPADSFVHILDDDTSLPPPSPPKTLIEPPALHDTTDTHDDTDASPRRGHTLSSPILHIQSPTLRSTYILSPPAHPHPPHTTTHRTAPAPAPAPDLGITLPWIHMQVRNMGRPWCFELGIVDASGRAGRIRCSTFQTRPSVRTSSQGSPILHLPFRFPSPSSRPLTAWSTTSLHIPSLMPLFSTERPHAHAHAHAPVPLPSAQFSHVSFVKVYATCRLRRIWFTAEKPEASTEPWEFGLYSR